ncbi:MAG: bifunctional folylpolyglutamate synthase/dihydrofolate synthase, partial [Myxococcales bacterium]|nr:bifunctional folylpolyglutamate synthase/dihydrofolate synthase [Myxococcales bacterium]
AVHDPARVGELHGARQAGHEPGRLERVERDGVTVLLDCAHNSHAVEALTQALGDLDPARSHLVFGALGDKSWQEMLAGLAPLAARRYYCPPIVELAGRLPAPPSALAESQPGAAFDAPEAAIDAALAAASPGDTILVTGSIFLVGAVRVHLVGGPRDVAVAL